MNRRNFIKMGGAAVVASPFAGFEALASEKADTETTRELAVNGLKARFLGTGAADWNGVDERGEQRRLSSILLDDNTLIDFTATAKDMIPENCHPQTIFYTHSHGDHFDPQAALLIGITKVYAGETWIGRCRSDFARASQKMGLPAPDIRPIAIGQQVNVNGLVFTALPGNHCTGDIDEQCLIYLVEKGPVRMIYATDTGGIPGKASWLSGIDLHHSPARPITALVMEATMGMDYEEDYRIFVHSSVGTVYRTAKVLLDTKRYLPEKGQPVYLTHMARTLHGTQDELDRDLPSPIRAAYDGLEVVFR